MRFTIREAALLLGLLAALAGAEDRNERSKETIDAAFVKKAASANSALIKAAELAEKEAVSSDVRAFAERLIKDHRNAQSDLKDAARSAGVEQLSGGMLSEDEKRDEAFARHKGKSDFDSAFAKHMVESHTRAVELYEKAETSAQQVAVRRYIEKILPILRKHLETSQKLVKATGGGERKK